jgi:hypothetical protein
MINECLRLRFDCVQGVFKAFSMPVLFNKFIDESPGLSWFAWQVKLQPASVFSQTNKQTLVFGHELQTNKIILETLPCVTAANGVFIGHFLQHPPIQLQILDS